MATGKTDSPLRLQAANITVARPRVIGGINNGETLSSVEFLTECQQVFEWLKSGKVPAAK